MKTHNPEVRRDSGADRVGVPDRQFFGIRATRRPGSSPTPADDPRDPRQADTADEAAQAEEARQDAAPATIGIADQHGESFTDPLFTALGVKHVRLNLAWDALQYDWQVAELDAWMAQAQAAGVEPLVIFSQSRVAGRTRLLPSPAEFRKAVDALLARYPFVHEFAAWNEANHTGQPTYRRPDAVAAYYKVLVTTLPGLQACCRPRCSTTRTSCRGRASCASAIRRLGLPEPRLWGLHNYSDVNYLRDRATREVLKALKGKVWITESGGVVDATSPTASRFPLGAPHAARVARYILGPMLLRSPRIDARLLLRVAGAARRPSAGTRRSSRPTGRRGPPTR